MDFLGLPMAPSVTGEERDAELSFKGNEKCRQLVSSLRPDPQAFLLPDGSGTEGQERPQNALKTPSKCPRNALRLVQVQTGGGDVLFSYRSYRWAGSRGLAGSPRRQRPGAPCFLCLSAHVAHPGRVPP